MYGTQVNIYGGASLRKSQKHFIVDNRLAPKYASDIGFTLEKIYRMSIFVWCSQIRLQQFVIAFLSLLVSSWLTNKL